MKIFTFLLILITVFIVNIGLYSSSEGYRSFLKGFKNDEAPGIVNDDYLLEKEDEINASESTFEANLTEKVTLDSLSITQEEGEIATVQQEVNEPKKLEMSEYEKEVLFLFNDYSFTKLQSQSDLFDLTYEYPNDNGNEYFEYYSPNLTLIIFSNNTYEEVRERLKVIGDLENFKINEIDNFGDESFYINVADNFDDGDIRLVFTKEGKSFGLKISKNEYNNVKQILENL